MVDDTRQRLMDAAGPIFADRGYRSTTVREICTQAGVNLALVNYHFGDKENLYVAAVGHAAERCMARIPLPTWPLGISSRQKMLDFVTMFVNRVAVPHDPVWHSQLIMREMQHPTRACADFVRNFVQPQATMLDGIVSEMLPDGVSLMQRQMICFSIVGQVLHYWSARPVIKMLVGEKDYERFDVEAISQHVTSFSLAAIDGLVRRLKKPRTPSRRKQVRS